MNLQRITTNENTFKLSYDMQETKGHTINAEMLGASIISTSRAINAANRIVNGEDSLIDVQVKAHHEGSFMVEFVTFVGEHAQDILAILGFTVGGVVVGNTVLGAMEQLKDQKIAGQIKQNGASTGQLVLDSGEVVEFTPEVASIITDEKFRKELTHVLYSPIHGKDGAKAIFKDENDNDIAIVMSEDSTSFKPLPRNSLTEEDHETKQVTIHFSQVNFDGPSGWRIKLPNGDVVTAKMKDQSFIDRINKGYAEFNKMKPALISLDKTVKTKPDGTSKTSYTIKEMIRQVND
ncbi:hypothetical protein [Vibrio scophthalmi]|uniref:Uncharacterized protein n=1 Tax=Vibrio scophthalmi TaxID=45658 RepID=A0A1E3WN75_9VIBR|nr:hypothetical protein [Vibrio scophthalmi]ODS10947.1 hypothetical protein VSF3289_01208 [Vibrio scophthalmi]